MEFMKVPVGWWLLWLHQKGVVFPCFHQAAKEERLMEQNNTESTRLRYVIYCKNLAKQPSLRFGKLVGQPAIPGYCYNY
jgi:hypothetical protein